MISPVLDERGVQVFHAECLDVLRQLDDASVDAVVSDPPYGLADLRSEAVVTALTAWANGDRERVPDGRGFMGRAWDAFVPPPAVWDECLRVLRPGGHALVFAGTRTMDLMGLSMRLAGFEIRDSLNWSTGTLAWYYGSGFPKSRTVSRDKRFCQCVPSVRDVATEEAAESAAEVLLADLRRRGEKDATHIADLHGVPVHVHANLPIPGRAEEDLLGGLCSEGDQRIPSGGPAPDHASRETGVRSLRDGVHASPSVAEEGHGPDVLPTVQRQAPRRGVCAARSQGSGCVDGCEQGCARREDDGGAEPGLARRGDVQAGEGQLHRPEVRPVSSGSAGDDGPVRRIHSGAPASDGALDRATADSLGMREPHRPQSEEQRQGEPGTLSDERGPQAWRGWPLCSGCGKPALPAGLGTALKPAWEPIIMGRKPLDGTVAANVLAHRTGALNIDGCRVGTSGGTASSPDATPNRLNKVYGVGMGGLPAVDLGMGRWPPNVLLDEHAAAVLDEQSGITTSSGGSGARSGKFGAGVGGYGFDGSSVGANAGGLGDTGGASRFFPTFRWEPKAPTSERPMVGGVAHPTVKPVALMAWLVRLLTPPGGLVLDPFAGTGTTGQAAAIQGFRALLIERDDAHIPLIEARLRAKPREANPDAAPAAPSPDGQTDLFDFPMGDTA